MSIISFLYLNQTIKVNKGSINDANTIPNALEDKFDIVEIVLLCLIFFGIGRLYQLFLNSKQS